MPPYPSLSAAPSLVTATVAGPSGLSGMRADDYREILAAVEVALEACCPANGFIEEVDRKICGDLREARAQVLRLLAGTAGSPDPL